MSKDILIRALNQDCRDELQAIIQYMMDHMMGEGTINPAATAIFKSHAMSEMKHYERLAERVIQLGGVPATSVEPFKNGGTMKEQIKKALKEEQKAVEQYQAHIILAKNQDDQATRLLLEQILLEEEKHARELEGLNEES